MDEQKAQKALEELNQEAAQAEKAREEMKEMASQTASDFAGAICHLHETWGACSDLHGALEDYEGDECELDTHIATAQKMILPAIEMHTAMLKYMLDVMELANAKLSNAQARFARKEAEQGKKVNTWVRQNIDRLCELEEMAKKHGWEQKAEGSDGKAEGKAKGKGKRSTEG